MSTARADELRRAFDASFAHAPVRAGGAVEDVLAIRVGGEARALRLAEVAALHADVAVVAIPSPVAELRGLAGVRNTLVPVYDLAALTGLPLAAAPRWLVIARGAAPIGLAFDDVLAHVRVPAAEVARGSIAIDGVRRPIVEVARVVEAIEARVRLHGPAGAG